MRSLQTWMAAIAMAAALAVAGSAAAQTPDAPAAKPGADWPTFGNAPGGGQYSTLTQINAEPAAAKGGNSKMFLILALVGGAAAAGAAAALGGHKGSSGGGTVSTPVTNPPTVLVPGGPTINPPH